MATDQETAAETIGVDARTLQRWRRAGCPPHGKSRKYVIRDIVEWARENKWGSTDDTLIDSVQGGDDDKLRLLRERANKLERENQMLDLKLAERLENLVEIGVVQERLLRASSIVRSRLELIERRFGRDVVDMFLESLDDADRIIDEELASGVSDDDGD